MGDVGQPLIGLTYSPRDVREFGLLVLRSSNIQNGKLAFDNNVYVEMDVPQRVIVREGDILICVRNGSKQLIGKCALIDKKNEGHAFGAFMGVYRSDLSGYAFYQFQSENVQRQINEVMGATINQLTNRNLNDFIIPVPPTKAEQTAIATALSDADALIESLEQLIHKKRNIKHGAMQELLTGKKRLPGFSGGWEVRRLGDVGATYGGLTGKTKSDFGAGAAQYITFMNVMSNVVIDSQIFDSVNVLPTESQNRVMKGDLFFNGSSETPEEVGLCAFLAENVKDVYLNSFCFGFRFRDIDKANGVYLAYYFRSNQGRELLKSLAQGATRYNLSKTALLKTAFPLPTLEEQTAIATILSDMDADIAALEEKLNKAKAVKQGMMQELLTGRVRLV
jgi:type I restriction enzyme S subunit